MSRILCFGDSNTWGYCPGLTPPPRFDQSVRWTQLLQQKLGTSHTVLEFGLCGCEAGGKGKSMCFNADGPTLFPPVLFASLPVDVIFIMLGTNDLKKVNQWKMGDTAKGLSAMIQSARTLCPSARLILASPVILDERVLSDAEFGPSAVEDSKTCAQEVKELSEKEHISFFDTNAVVQSLGPDGCHFTAEAHAAFAQALSAFLKNIIG